jgi:FMN-dependent NADH-azoreductase
MMQILIVESSSPGTESASRKLTNKLRERLQTQYPEARVIERDLVKDKLPHLDQLTLKAISTKDPVEAESLKEAAYLSDQLVDELMMSDLLVIACPMWNFGIPSSLKAWIDYVVRAGKTFNYAGAGVEGLAKDKKAILVLASGGVFSEGLWKSWDWPTVLLAAKTYGKGFENPPLSSVFAPVRAENPIFSKTCRRCMA